MLSVPPFRFTTKLNEDLVKQRYWVQSFLSIIMVFWCHIFTHQIFKNHVCSVLHCCLTQIERLNTHLLLNHWYMCAHQSSKPWEAQIRKWKISQLEPPSLVYPLQKEHYNFTTLGLDLCAYASLTTCETISADSVSSFGLHSAVIIPSGEQEVWLTAYTGSFTEPKSTIMRPKSFRVVCFYGCSISFLNFSCFITIHTDLVFQFFQHLG